MLRTLLALAAILAVAGSSFADEQIAGQTSPSADYLRDDVQFFPAAPELRPVAAPAAAQAPAVEPADRYMLNFGVGLSDEIGVFATVAFRDKVRGIDVPNVTLPLSLVVHPRVDLLVAYVKWMRERDAHANPTGG